MQKIKTVRWPRRNIGGDRAMTKLFYVRGLEMDIPSGNNSVTDTILYNVGAHADPQTNTHTIHGMFGETPNLSTMGALYTRYRIRGIALKLTYWQESGPPVLLFTNAATSTANVGPAMNGPTPAFVPTNISTTTEQRWAKYRTCGMTAQGAKPTVLKTYYSVNKVFGPDQIVKNDEIFTGAMSPSFPYWSTADTPDRGPWIEFGITSLTGSNITTAVNGVLKMEATVYAEFFGRRSQTQ